MPTSMLLITTVDRANQTRETQPRSSQRHRSSTSSLPRVLPLYLPKVTSIHTLQEIITKKKASVIAETASLGEKINKDAIPSRDLLDRLSQSVLFRISLHFSPKLILCSSPLPSSSQPRRRSSRSSATYRRGGARSSHHHPLRGIRNHGDVPLTNSFFAERRSFSSGSTQTGAAQR